MSEPNDLVALPRSATLKGVTFLEEGMKYDLALTIGELDDLDGQFGLGPSELLNTLATNAWKPIHVSQTIYYGLKGAGMDGEKARGIVDRNVTPGQFAYWRVKAIQIVSLVIRGDPTDPVGEPEAAESISPPSKTPTRMVG